MSKPILVHALGIAILALGVGFALASVHWPPSSGTAKEAAGAFSAARAMEDVKALSRKPHPVGSAAHGEVLTWLQGSLRQAGYESQVQRTTVATRFAGQRVGAKVANVVARLSGSRGSGPALLLVAHYDSVPQSPGASDDGSGVAVLLETARGLKASPRLTNDVLFLFTDGEELGLLGAHAFMAEHPAAKEVALALNFEARGTRGPVVMYDPSPASGGFIDDFAKAAPRPYGGSFIAWLAQLLPNDTDATVFKKAGVAVLGFAFADGIEHYHTGNDAASALDPATLGHGGETALALARHFGNADLTRLAGENPVYFDIFGRWVARYSKGVARALAAMTSAWVLFLIILGHRRGRFTSATLAFGFLLSLAAALLSAAGATLLHFALVRFCGFHVLAQAGPIFAMVILAGTAFVVFRMAGSMKSRMGMHALAMGAMLVWLLLLIVCAAFVPAASAVLQWPLAFMAIFGAPWFVSRRPEGNSPIISLYIGLFLTLVFTSQDLHTIFVATGVSFPALAALGLALLAGLVVPWWIPLPVKILRRIAWVSFVAALSLVLFIGAWSRLSGNVSRADHLAFGIESRWGLASLFTRDEKPSERVKAILGGDDAVRANLSVQRGSEVVTMRAMPLPSIEAPDIRKLSDVLVDGKRHLTLSLKPGSGARGLRLWDAGGAKIHEERLDGKAPRELIRFSREADEKLYRMILGEAGAPVWHMDFWGAGTQAMRLDLVVDAGSPVLLHAVDEHEGFPIGVSIPPRPKIGIPRMDGDVTLVGKRFVF